MELHPLHKEIAVRAAIIAASFIIAVLSWHLKGKPDFIAEWLGNGGQERQLLFDALVMLGGRAYYGAVFAFWPRGLELRHGVFLIVAILAAVLFTITVSRDVEQYQEGESVVDTILQTATAHASVPL